MTLEEKIAHLQATSMEQARLEGNVIIDTHQAALEKVFEDHKAEAIRQSETRIKAEAANAKLSLNQAPRQIPAGDQAPSKQDPAGIKRQDL